MTRIRDLMNKPRIADLRNICDPARHARARIRICRCRTLTQLFNAKQNQMTLSGIVVVTGGAGFIGSHIAETIARQGSKVRIVDDFSTGHRENIDGLSGDIEVIEGSVADLAADESCSERC